VRRQLRPADGRATLADAEKLSAISRQTFYDTFTGTCTEEDMQNFLEQYFNVAQVQRELSNFEDYFYFAEVEGMPVGYLRFMEDYNNWPLVKQWKALELKRLYVIKEYHGKGIAQQLMDFFILFAKNELGNINALIVEDNPFYGLSNKKVKSVDSTTDDNLINIKLEHSPQTIKKVSPEFFKVTLFYKNNNQSVLHVDTDIIITKNGKALYKESSEFSQGYVHTPNGIVLSSYKFPGPGQYVISVKVVGINFMPVEPKQVNFAANVTESKDKYLVNITK